LTSIALVFLLTPTAILTVRRFLKEGLAVDLRSLSTLFSGLGLLCVFSYVTVNSGPLGLPNPEFFPLGGYWLFILSGLAFSVVTFPGQVAELEGASWRRREGWIPLMLVIPAWLWLVVAFLAATGYAG